ncbi:MAG: hypothetical protein LBK99_22185 [Opitutaceae bacterium]|jgi:hypothetical protein|nr:hypothetical protein [Opitutaceae bacterium]
MSPYEEILNALSEAGIDFIVGGGVACVLHGVERVTMDVDISLHLTPENLDRFIRASDRLGLRPRIPVPPESLLDEKAVQMMVNEKHALVYTLLDPDRPVRQIDVFLVADLSYENLLPDSVWVELGNIKVRIIGKKRLLDIKRGINPPRLKDALDIEFLQKNENA